MAAPAQQQRGSGIEGKAAANDAPMDVQAFIASTAALVGLERRAEVEEEGAYKAAKSSKELERAGVLLSRLVVTDIATGLYGRCLLTLEPARGGLLPQSEFSVRDIVEINSTQAPSAASASSSSSSSGPSGSSKIASGVIYRLKETSLTLVLDDFLDPQARLGQLSVLKLANQVTYDRYKFGLDFLAKEFGSGGGLGVSSRLMRVLYGDVVPVATTRPTSWIPFSRSLNETQKVAVQNALDANDLYMIHGPPGTGKTTTVVELIRQFVSRGLRVLACAPSNLAVDNLVEKLGEKLPMRQIGKQSEQEQRSLQQQILGNTPASSSAAFSQALANSSASSAFQSNRGYDLRITRLGHPARIIPSVLKYTLDSVVHASDAEAVCAAMRADMAALNKSIDKSRDRNERNGMRKEVRELQRALRDRERRAISESLLSTEVLCCTLVNAASKLMDPFGAPGGGFDVVVIDEAAQALEVACLLPAMKGRKLILAGDPCQLGPTVKSKEACDGGFERTLFDRLLSKPYGASITTMLVEQYRMHATIMEWSSREMYQGRLKGPESITTHLLSGLEGVRATEDTQAAFVVIDTAGLNLWEDDPADDAPSIKQSLLQKVQQRSKSNTHEAALLRTHLESLLSSGVKLKDIGLITPYNGQVSLLREQLLETYPALEIGTVDGFQGREKEAILISMVRSNSAREVGFLREDRRMNVAITRARRHVCIILDSDTVGSHPFLARLVDYASEHGDYRMAADLNEVRQDLSGAGNAGARGEGREDALSPGAAPHAANDGERKEDGVDAASHQSPIVSKPRVKKERVRPALPASAAASASVGAAGGVVQPVSEEWSESRLVSMCEDMIRAGRRVVDSRPLDHRTQFVFPSTLNSFERHLVHEVAERVGGKELSHEAQGEGIKRFITLRYVWPKAESTASAAPSASFAAAAAEPGAPVAADDDDDDVETGAVEGPDGDLDAAKRASKRAAKKNNKKQAQLAAAQQQLQVQEEQRVAAAAAKEDARRKALDRMELKSTGKVSKAAPARPATVPAPAPTAAAASSAPAPAAASTAFAALAEPDDDAASTAAASAAPLDDDADDAASSAAAASSSVPSASKSKNAANKKKKKAEAAAAAASSAGAGDAAADDDFDSMLSEFGSDVCKSAGCSARVKVMGFLCDYCKEKFCLKHMNPVLHGCAAAHKQKQLAAMSSALKQQQKGGGSGSAHLRDSDKALLHSKLEKKIAEDKKARTKQTKKEEGKK